MEAIASTIHFSLAYTGTLSQPWFAKRLLYFVISNMPSVLIITTRC